MRPVPASPGSSVDRRLDWLDAARGAGIVFVVVGHVLGGLVGAGLAPALGPEADTVAFLYAFHMPLFFFLSGLLADAGPRRPFPDFLAGRLGNIAWPYFLWSVLQVGLHAAASGVTTQPVAAGALARLAWEPVQQFWFLYVLFVVSIAWSLLRRAGVPGLALLAASVALWFVPGRGSLGDWGVAYMVAAQAPWFAAGAVVGAARAGVVVAAAPRGAALASSLFLFGLVAAASARGLGSPTPYALLALDVLRGAVSVAGIAATLLFAAASGPTALGALLRRLGRASLAIYVAHTIVLAAVRVALAGAFGWRDPLLHAVVATVAALLLPVLLDAAATRVGARWIFTLSLPRRGATRGGAPVVALPEGA